MSTINFNLTNKNNEQIKNEILTKMLKIKDKYNNDSNYYDLFYNVVQNSSSKNNMKLSIQRDGNYSLQYGGNKQNSYGWVNSNFELLTNKSKNTYQENNDNYEDDQQYDEQEQDNQQYDEQDEQKEQSEQQDEQQDQQEQQEQYDQQIQVNEEETGESQLSYQEKRKQFEKDNNCLYNPGWFSSKQNCKSIEEKMKNEENNQTNNGQFGGYTSGSEYESDASYFSSDEEDEEFVPIMTTVFDDDEGDDMMDHYKNMRSTKYLKNLHTDELRQILRNNNANVSKNNKYLTKNEMIKSIRKIYKN